MKLFSTDHFELPLPAKHRFPMAKYRLLRECAAAGGGREFLVPAPAEDAVLRRAHTASYVQKMTSGNVTALEQRRIGFPWSPQLVVRSRYSTGATVAAARAAIQEGVAVNLAGGTHHAFADAGAGYCVFNDTAVAARQLQAEGLARRVVIIDCDVHQGNGTASILAGDDTVFTFSIHGERNYPFRKAQSDLDVALPDGTTDAVYLAKLAESLEHVWKVAGAETALYIAGADPFEGDRLGRLRISKQGLQQRDQLVLSECRRRGLPVAIVMGGGYARQVEDIVQIHCATVDVAQASM